MFDDGVWVVYVFVDECIDICVGVMIGMFVYVLLIDVDGVVLCGVVVGDMVYLYGVGGFVCLYGELFVFGVVFGVWFVDLQVVLCCVILLICYFVLLLYCFLYGCYLVLCDVCLFVYMVV